MDRLSGLLDNVGWIEQKDQRAYNTQVFKWMTEVTNRILEIEHRLGVPMSDGIEDSLTQEELE